MKLKRPKFKNLEPGEFPETGDEFDVCELKYDGWWGQLLLEGDRWELYSRTGMLKKFGPLKRPVERTLLHGEFIYGTEWAKDNPSMYDKIAVYGAEWLGGRHLRAVPQGEVRRLVTATVDALKGEKIESGLFMAEQWPLERARQMWNYFKSYEGMVFKNSRAPWGAPFGRMKRDVTMEYVCMGFESSDSERHRGWGVASVLGGLFYNGKSILTQACKVGGLNDAQRADYHRYPDRFIGKVFEASGKKISKRGALRHPNFVRWRLDKQPEECKWP